MIRMTTAAANDQGAIRKSADAKLACPLAALPTTIGPTPPPRLPIMLMKPIAEAAAVEPRNIVGIGQNAGKCAYKVVPTHRIITITGQIQTPSSQAARKTEKLKNAIGTAACHGRSLLRS